jgi:hypothetical protein
LDRRQAWLVGWLSVQPPDNSRYILQHCLGLLNRQLNVLGTRRHHHHHHHFLQGGFSSCNSLSRNTAASLPFFAVYTAKHGWRPLQTRRGECDARMHIPSSPSGVLLQSDGNRQDIACNRDAQLFAVIPFFFPRSHVSPCWVVALLSAHSQDATHTYLEGGIRRGEPRPWDELGRGHAGLMHVSCEADPRCREKAAGKGARQMLGGAAYT